MIHAGNRVLMLILSVGSVIPLALVVGVVEHRASAPARSVLPADVTTDPANIAFAILCALLLVVPMLLALARGERVRYRQQFADRPNENGPSVGSTEGPFKRS